MTRPDGDPNDSNRKLISYLERLSGKQVRLPSGIRRRAAKAAFLQARGTHTRQLVLAAVMTVAYQQYYFLDVQLQILAQPSVTVFVSERPQTPSS